MLPKSVEVTITCHGQPMQDRGGRVTWEGTKEITTKRYRCVVCGNDVAITATTEVGPPEAVISA